MISCMWSQTFFCFKRGRTKTYQFLTQALGSRGPCTVN
jgi:hypothetical protein